MPAPVLEEATPSAALHDALLTELRAFTGVTVGAPDNHDFALVIRAPGSPEVLGGLWAQSRWGGFNIDIVVVGPTLRGQGWGARLLAAAETEARRRGCWHILLDTYAFQARGFYEQHGFAVFGEIPGPGPIYPRYFMRKDLG
jgi:GNAT superfamily N-acetyltransferase